MDKMCPWMQASCSSAQRRSTACSCPGGRENPGSCSYSLHRITLEPKGLLTRTWKIWVFSILLICFLNLIRFHSWNEIMRQLWKPLVVRNRAGLLAECCCAPLSGYPLHQAALRPPSSEKVETLLQLQHSSKLSLPHSSWPSSLASFQSIFIPCCFRACVCWCCGM